MSPAQGSRVLDDAEYDSRAIEIARLLDGLAISHALAILDRSRELLLWTHTVDGRLLSTSETTSSRPSAYP